MHMADALISPVVGGTMWVVTAGLTAYSAKKLKENLDDSKAPLMGVLGAFIFAAQMINFTIPATGSSGHLGGGMILTILLGPYAAFLTLASILVVQALFFADGGILALGCNIFNMGFFPCFIAYPYIYRKIVGDKPTSKTLLAGCLLSGILALQMGAFGVVLETLFSGISELPFGTFVLLMQPIHLGIGIVEGFVTAAVVTFVWKARPEVLEAALAPRSLGVVRTEERPGGTPGGGRPDRCRSLVVRLGQPRRVGVVHGPDFGKGRTPGPGTRGTRSPGRTAGKDGFPAGLQL